MSILIINTPTMNNTEVRKDYRMIFAKNVRTIRRIKDMSQEALALSANISRVYIGDIEKAKRAVSIDVMSDIAYALDVSLIDLLNDEFFIHKVTGENNDIDQVVGMKK